MFLLYLREKVEGEKVVMCQSVKESGELVRASAPKV